MPATRIGEGNNPFLDQRQTVGLEIPNSCLTTGNRTIAQSGKDSK